MRATGSTHFYLGELDQARKRLGEIKRLDTTPENQSNPLLFDVVDAWVTARSYESWTLWLQGRVNKAFKQINAAMEMANHLNHPFSMALSSCFATWLYQFQGDKENTLKLAEESIKIAKQNGFTFWVGWAEILKAWALDDENVSERYLNDMHAGFELWKSLGSRLGSSYFQYLIAESLLRHGNTAEAWTILEEAKSYNKRTNEAWWDAELFRLEGKLNELESPNDLVPAEVSYRKALSIAQKQNAKSLELRAANSLATLLSNTPKRSEGYLLLKDCISWFDQDLDTPDIQQAKSTLKSLSVIEN